MCFVVLSLQTQPWLSPWKTVNTQLILTYIVTNIKSLTQSSVMSLWCYLSADILSVTTGSVSFFIRSHMWRLEAASSTQKTVGRVWVHCSATTGSPAVLFLHSATGCSWLTECSLMLPSAQPTCKKHRGNEGAYIFYLYSINQCFRCLWTNPF